MKRYFGFERSRLGESYESLLEEWEIAESDVKDEEILFAHYGLGSYCGSAFVVLERDRKPFEVNGSHCSCCGLEGQWEPEETTWAALAMKKPEHILDLAEPDAIEAFKALVANHTQELSQTPKT